MGNDLPVGGRRISMEECDRRWDARTPIRSPRLAGVSAPWCVVAGWALDLFVGEQTREHDDIEIAVPRAAFGEVAAALHEYEWDVVGAGTVWPLAAAAEHPGLHQTWLQDPSTSRYHLDVFREPHDGDRWICRRGNAITLPYTELIENGPTGIPYVIPEVALLFKSQGPPRERRHRLRTSPAIAAAVPHRATVGMAHPPPPAPQMACCVGCSDAEHLSLDPPTAFCGRWGHENGDALRAAMM
jgi:hypothetical protein